VVRAATHSRLLHTITASALVELSGRLLGGGPHFDAFAPFLSVGSSLGRHYEGMYSLSPIKRFLVFAAFVSLVAVFFGLVAHALPN
jgi:hypothetical protein